MTQRLKGLTVAVNPQGKPLAAPGLTSYRYKVPRKFDYIMIGAKDIGDALKEAQRSLTSGIAQSRYLEIWDGTQYRSVHALSTRSKPKAVSSWTSYNTQDYADLMLWQDCLIAADLAEAKDVPTIARAMYRSRGGIIL